MNPNDRDDVIATQEAISPVVSTMNGILHHQTADGAWRDPLGSPQEEIESVRAVLDQLEDAVHGARTQLRALEITRLLRPMWDRVVAEAGLREDQDALYPQELAHRLVEIETQEEMDGLERLEDVAADITCSLVLTDGEPLTGPGSQEAIAAREERGLAAARVVLAGVWEMAVRRSPDEVWKLDPPRILLASEVARYDYDSDPRPEYPVHVRWEDDEGTLAIKADSRDQVLEDAMDNWPTAVQIRILPQPTNER
ncbi:hypothetical protein ABZ234_08150 [Nocardiopsis sp. NPDC006198]|uniref:hypothetical protein n=1 Tax=Nocardiopsis sp. NPDC006198 TaxID=3154472 RepID=UPI0033B233DF